MAGTAKQFDWRKHKEKMLKDEEVWRPEEIAAHKKKVRMAIQLKDKKLIAEEEKIKAQGYCGKCGMMKTTIGECSSGRH